MNDKAEQRSILQHNDIEISGKFFNVKVRSIKRNIVFAIFSCIGLFISTHFGSGRRQMYSDPLPWGIELSFFSPFVIYVLWYLYILASVINLGDKFVIVSNNKVFGIDYFGNLNKVLVSEIVAFIVKKDWIIVSSTEKRIRIPIRFLEIKEEEIYQFRDLLERSIRDAAALKGIPLK